MLVEIPEAIMNSDLTPQAKLIAGLSFSGSNSSASAIAKLLNVSKRTVERSLKLARQCDTSVAKSDTYVAKSDTSVARSSSSSNKEILKKEETPTLKPTRSQVDDYAKKHSRTDLAAEFFEHYEERSWLHNGEPLKDWRAMFKGWVRNYRTPSKPASNKGKPQTAEAARLEVDMQAY